MRGVLHGLGAIVGNANGDIRCAAGSVPLFTDHAAYLQALSLSPPVSSEVSPLPAARRLSHSEPHAAAVLGRLYSLRAPV